jgi:hypothetical protein
MLKPILLATALFAGLAPLTAPPMKMGLWENTSTVKMSGADVPPGMQQQTMKLHQCITPETWAKAFQRSDRTCQFTNQSQNGGHFTVDISCTNGSGHVEMNFSNQESGHGTVDMHMTHNGSTMSITSSVEMHYLGASCGSVSPEKPEIVR